MEQNVRVHATVERQHPFTHVLERLAATGIYLVRGIPRDLQRAARVRAAGEGTTLRWVLLQALRDYAAGTWRPRREAPAPARDGG
jgi:hypothetical protein